MSVNNFASIGLYITYLLDVIFSNVIIFTCLLTDRLEREIQQYTFIVMWIQCNIVSLILRYNEISTTFITSVPFLLFIYMMSFIW